MLSLQRCVAGNVLFASLESDELTEVLDAMFLCNKQGGDIIMKQGDEGDNFYCIDKGTVEVWIAKDGGEPEFFSDITDGGSFGELALIYGTPRAATIKAKTDCVLWAIDRDSYRRILMGSVMRKRKMYEEFLEKVQLLQGLDKWERLSVADALEPASFKDGEVIMRQGDEADCFYLIVEGKAVVTQTNAAGESRVVNELTSGQYFGTYICMYCIFTYSKKVRQTHTSLLVY
jgi:cAMP-dependent protein kinase regulator